MLKAIKSAFPHTLPIMAGYVFLGIAFGFLMKTSNFPLYAPILMSVVIYSGALEFASISLLSSAFNPLSAFVMALLISARHLFYGIPMLKKYENTGAWKILLIFGLTDETFSVASSLECPEGIEKKHFYSAITLLNYSYWVGGTIVGALFGQFLTFDTTGIDFALTALFLVLFLEQLKTREGKISGAIGLLATTLALVLFGAEKMVIVAMAIILLLLLAGKKGVCRD